MRTQMHECVCTGFIGCIWVSILNESHFFFSLTNDDMMTWNENTVVLPPFHRGLLRRGLCALELLVYCWALEQGKGFKQDDQIHAKLHMGHRFYTFFELELCPGCDGLMHLTPLVFCWDKCTLGLLPDVLLNIPGGKPRSIYLYAEHSNITIPGCLHCTAKYTLIY